MVESDRTLSLDEPWAIGEENYRKILEAVSDKNINRIVEFGSGRSTVRLGKDFHNANLLSIEHDELFYKHTLNLLQEYDTRNVVVIHCPLKRKTFGIRSYLSYDLNDTVIENGVDFVLIDGPVESETIRGREAPLYAVFPCIKVGGIVALHDYHRDSAKAVVRNWLNSYRGSLRILKEYKRLILLEKYGEQNNISFPGIMSIIDNLRANAILVGRRTKRFLKEIIKGK